MIIFWKMNFLFYGLLKLNNTKNYFYKPEVGILNYIVDGEGHALYLINKSNLPASIKDQLIGGDAGSGTYSDYASLNDVYGVTSNLKVYYSRATGEDLIGITKEQLDKDDPLRTVFDSTADVTMYGLLTVFDQDEDGKVTSEEVKSVKEMTITSDSMLTDLNDLYNLPNLKELTITNKNLKNLSGIQNAPSLDYVFFQGCEIEDYSALCDMKNRLKYLYMYNIDNKELKQICKDIKSVAFTELEYMAFVGNTSYINLVNVDFWTDSRKSEKTLTDISPLADLNDTTKKTVKYLTLHNNNIGDTMDGSGNEVTKYALEYLSGFESLYLLRLSNNSLTSLKGLENMKNLIYLIADRNLLGKYEKEEKDPINDAVASIREIDSLQCLNLRINYSLKWIEYIKDLSSLEKLLLDDCTGMNDVSVASIKDLLKGLRK